MSVFAYTALQPDGRTVQGTVPADTRHAAIGALLGRGLHPVDVHEEGNGRPARSVAAAGKPGRVRQAHVEAFTRELATLLAGGVPLARALHLLQREATQPGPRQLWSDVREHVVGGESLADALAKHPKAFSSIYIAMVRAGETGGFLDVVLTQIAEFRTREQDLKGRIKAALIYPCVLGILAVGVLVFLLTFFIPKFSGIFADFGASLPALTKAILAASELVTKYGLVVAIAAAIAGMLLKRAAESEAGRRAMERTLLRIPMVGRVVAHFALVRFSRMLGTLLTAGVPLVSSLRTAKEAIGNQTLADTVVHGIEQVQRGASLARSLSTAQGLFPPSVIEMVAIAEETGRLDKELVRLAMVYESDLDRQLRILVALTEPLLLFVMAALIGTVVVGMLLPVFTMQDLIK